LNENSYNKGCMEDRRFPRLDIDEPVGIHAGDYYKVEKARQFSEGGMLFESQRDFTEGQLVAMTFQLSDTVLIRLNGEIAYTVQPVSGARLIGVRFVGPDNEHVKILIEYFKKRGSC
jgi:PilZ domain